MAVYRCLLCYPNEKERATLSNMKSHLGTTRYANHNMGPFRCQVPGCTKRAVREDIDTRHGTPSHAPIWVRDQALVSALDTLAQQCEYPWTPHFAPATSEPAPLAATQGPPVAAQGHSVSVSVAHAPAQGSFVTSPIIAVQGPPSTAQAPAIAASVVTQAPGIAQVTPAAAQVHPAAAQVPTVVAPTAQVPAGVASAAAQFPPPTDYFGHAMDDSERRYAGKTREDIEKQYEEEQEFYYHTLKLAHRVFQYFCVFRQVNCLNFCINLRVIDSLRETIISLNSVINTSSNQATMPYHCQRCGGYTTDDKSHFKSHLGRIDNAHNMGPWVCQVPGCNVRSNRRGSDTPHNSHPSLEPQWVRDPNLVDALNAELAASYRPAPLAPSAGGPAPPTTASPARSTTIGPTPPYFGPAAFPNAGRFQYPDPSLLATSNNNQGVFYGASTQGEDDNDNNEDEGPSGASAQLEHENPDTLAHGEDKDNNNASDDGSESGREYLMRTGVAPLFMEAMKLLSFADPPPEKPLLWAGKWFEARSREIEGVDEEATKKADENKSKKEDENEDKEEDEHEAKKEDEKDDQKEDK
ncbi:hypothetical protein KCU77_g4179, partial [Aureobasidium melanogenum]